MRGGHRQQRVMHGQFDGWMPLLSGTGERARNNDQTLRLFSPACRWHGRRACRYNMRGLDPRSRPFCLFSIRPASQACILPSSWPPGLPSRFLLNFQTNMHTCSDDLPAQKRTSSHPLSRKPRWPCLTVQHTFLFYFASLAVHVVVLRSRSHSAACCLL